MLRFFFAADTNKPTAMLAGTGQVMYFAFSRKTLESEASASSSWPVPKPLLLQIGSLRDSTSYSATRIALLFFY